MSVSRHKGRLLVVAFLALWAWSAPAAEAARLHVIVAVDWTDPRMGPAMGLSRDEFLASVVRNTPERQCIIWEIHPDRRKARLEMQPIQAKVRPFGQWLGRDTMLGAIQGLRVAPDDAVLFFYCGHGAYSPRDGTYTMASGDRGQQVLFLSEIRTAIARKGPNFAAVVLDCCNELRPLPGEPRYSVPYAAHREDFSPLFDRLFFSRPGTLSVTSSSPFEYAIIVPATRHRGGKQYFGALFTNLFAGALNERMEDRLTWEQLLPRVQRDLDRDFNELCQGGVIPLGDRPPVRQDRQTIDFRW